MPTARSTSRGPGRPRPQLTGRALVLGGLVVLLVVVLASPISRYLGSRSDLSHAARQLGQDQHSLATLTEQKARYADPGYIQQQARARLQYAMPGDTVYRVVRKGQQSDLAQTRAAGATGTRSGTGWNTKLWNSVLAAGR